MWADLDLSAGRMSIARQLLSSVLVDGQLDTGHAGVSITLDTYAHVLPSMGRDAADRLGALLHG